MKPFLILQLRPNDKASDGEFYAMLKHGGLSEDEVVRVRMEHGGIPKVSLDKYSGVIVGGGPSDISTPDQEKSAVQRDFEKDLSRLLDGIVEKDFPYLGACYGLSSLSVHEGGTVSKERYAEGVEALTVYLSREADSDQLTAGLPKSFRAFAGHKESCQNLPDSATLLASSDVCPIHMIRVKENIYGTQFHTELDIPTIIDRINIYKNAGYFPPEDAEPLISSAQNEKVTVPMRILKRFVERYRK
jgi:GMP synthase (glutamine-hydrolysing)